MKKLILKGSALALAVVMLSGMVACNNTKTSDSGKTESESNNSNESSDEAKNTNDQTGEKTERKLKSTGIYEIEKYDPPIDLSAWRFLNAGIEFAEGDNIDKNVYIDYYREEFGINVSYDWVVPEEQFDSRLNMAIVSGDIPDVMWLNNKALIDMTEAGLLYDLTDLYDEYVSDFTKGILEQDMTSFDTAKIDDRLMAIPHTGSAIDGLQILHIRTDWLDKLGLEVPTDMKSLLEVAKAFTEQDPDGNGEDDTYGLALTKNFIGDNHAGATGFFAGFHGYIRRWIEKDDGTVVYGSIQPEVKEGLGVLQQMYADGLIDPEFGVKDRSKVTESIGAGKIGITYGGMSTPGAFVDPSVQNDPKAEWLALELLSNDEEPALAIAKMPVTRYYAVSKDCEHPEALLKLIDAAGEGYSEEQLESDWELGISEDGIPVFQYQLVGFEPAKKNLIAHQKLLVALEKNDPSSLNTEELGYYEKIKKFNEGDRTQWGQARIFGTPSSFDVIEKYVETENYIYNAFYGSLTPTMVEKNATLEAMEDEVFTGIIMGESLDRFDSFVEEWKSLGGDKITEEVNEWYKSSK